ncbi:CaiB/BaiF CoA transferase family protein [Burkholderia stagnalis]
MTSRSEVPAGRASGPLAGVRVIDMTSVAMGPYATQILGDMGADVVKVESPDGDVFRAAAPARHAGMGAAFLNLNRNKRSIALDLKREDERQTLIDLIAGADVLVYNVRPRAMRRYGLDYDSLRALNPRLIYCGTYGFSERGPYAGRPAFDDIIQAMSGLAALQGMHRDSGPAYVNTILADKTAGLAAAYAVSMALYERERSGVGQSLEVPMFETLVSFNLIEHLSGETFQPAEDSMGYARVLSPHRKPYPTRDGFIALMPYTTAQWQRFLAIAGRADLAGDARVTCPALRSRHIGELYGILADLVTRKTTSEWMALLKDADIPMTPVNAPEDLLDDPHLQAIDFFHPDMHASEGEIRTIGIPVQFSRTPGSVRRLAPRLDEHRDEILQELAGGGGTVKDGGH